MCRIATALYEILPHLGRHDAPYLREASHGELDRDLSQNREKLSDRKISIQLEEPAGAFLCKEK